MSEVRQLNHITTWVTLNALLKKGVLTYADVQASISEVRDLIPREHYTPTIASLLNIMEQTYQAGPYQSPLDRPGDPRP